MHERSFSTVFRCTLVVNNFGELKSISGPESLYEPNYTGNHIVLLECQLKSPNSLNAIDTNLLEFLNLYKLNFSNWRIVDIDHYMKGASFFPKQMKDTEWNAQITKTIGATAAERKIVIKDEAQLAQAHKMTEHFLNLLNAKEPRSNRGLEPFMTQEEADALTKGKDKKKAAAA